MQKGFTTDPQGHSRLDVTNSADGSHITVYEQGAHLTSWCTADGTELLYTSPKAVYKAGKAIRGGVPLIFPQFSDLGPLPTSHGFLRVRAGWSLVEDAQHGAQHAVTLRYRLKPGMEPDFAKADCTLTYTITFTATTLKLQMHIEHNGGDGTPLDFGFAFHSYFAVGDVSKVRVDGLDATAYLDNLQARKHCPAAPIHTIDAEVDRIYVDQRDKPITLRCPDARAGKTRQLTIVGRRLRDAVLWNPWVEKTKTMADMPEDGYRHFVCVEHGDIAKMEQLAPHASWEAAQLITVTHD